MSLNLKVFRCKKKHYEVSKKVWYAKFLGISYNRVELIILPLILTGVVKVSTSKGDYLASAGTTVVYNEVIDTVSRLKESLLSHGYAGYGKKFFFVTGTGIQEWFRYESVVSKGVLKKSFIKMEWLREMEMRLFGVHTDETYEGLIGGGRDSVIGKIGDCEIRVLEEIYEPSDFFTQEIGAYNDIRNGHACVFAFSFDIEYYDSGEESSIVFEVVRKLNVYEQGYRVYNVTGLHVEGGLVKATSGHDKVVAALSVAPVDIVMSKTFKELGVYSFFLNVVTERHFRLRWNVHMISKRCRARLRVRTYYLLSQVTCFSVIREDRELYSACACGKSVKEREVCESWQRCVPYSSYRCSSCRLSLLREYVASCLVPCTREGFSTFCRMFRKKVSVEPALTLEAYDEFVRCLRDCWNKAINKIFDIHKITARCPLLLICRNKTNIVRIDFIFHAMEINSCQYDNLIADVMVYMSWYVRARSAIEEECEGIWTSSDSYVRKVSDNPNLDGWKQQFDAL